LSTEKIFFNSVEIEQIFAKQRSVSTSKECPKLLMLTAHYGVSDKFIFSYSKL